MNKVLFTDKECLVLSKEFQLPENSQVVLRVPRRNNLYCFNLSDIQPERDVTCLLAKDLFNGLPSKLFTNEHNCVACNKGKQHKASYKAITAVSTISALSSYFNGPFGHNSSEALITRIKRDYSNARTPQQNGVAERKNRTLIEAARTMLADSKLPTMFWTEAVSTACYVLNRVLVTKPHNKTPYELVSGKVPNISHLKPFGCLVTILNTSDHLGKFEGKADEGFIVGYAAHSKAYRVYNLSSKKIEETLNLRYLEDKPNVQGLGHEWYFDLDYLTDSLGYTRFKTNQPAGPKVDEASDMHLGQADLIASRNRVPAGKVDSAAGVSYGPTETSTPVVKPVHTYAPSFPPGHSLGSSEHFTRYPSPSDLANTIYVHDQQRNTHTDYLHCLFACFLSQLKPSSVDQALNDPAWVEAMQEEMQQFINQKVWQLVPLPDGKIAIGTKWILKNKRDARGIVVRNKA
ncbi:putative ribonuclease H-like domain-containing protein, partial [Tanacetum coccineum]